MGKTFARVRAECRCLGRLEFRAVLSRQPEDLEECQVGEAVRLYLADMLVADRFTPMAVMAVLDHFSDPLNAFSAWYAAKARDRSDVPPAGELMIYDGRRATFDGRNGCLDLEDGGEATTSGGRWLRCVSYNLETLMASRWENPAAAT